MIMRGAWMPVLAIVATCLAAPCGAQYPPEHAAMAAEYQAQMQAMAQAQYMAVAQAQYGNPGMYPPGVMPAAYMQGQPPGPLPGGPPAPLPDVYGSYGSLPNGYAQQPAMDTQMPMGGACPYCGGMGCDLCGGRHGGHHHGDHGLLGDIFGICGPYADGGCGAVRWFDFAADFMMLRRDDVGRNVNLTSQGLGPGNIVLSTSDIDFDDASSFRFTGCLQVGPGGNVEFTYFGLFQYDDTQFVRRTGDNDLFSVFSQFGFVPLGGFVETDFSDFQQITYSSTFDSFEINYRQRWMAPNCRYQGSWLCGVRHFILDENFKYFTSSSLNGIGGDPLDPAQATFNTNVTNNLTGFQIGGDMWICLLPGLRAGGEVKAGVYGNHMNVNNTAFVNTGAPNFNESIQQNDVAFIGQADLTATYRINYQWTVRVGYQFLFLDGVALAGENFNTLPPNTFIPPPGVTRVPFINDNGNVFYHGWTAGLEFMW